MFKNLKKKIADDVAKSPLKPNQPNKDVDQVRVRMSVLDSRMPRILRLKKGNKNRQLDFFILFNV